MSKIKTKTKLIVIRGPIGSGKTTTAKLLRKQLKNSSHVDMDVIKKMINNRESTDWRRNLALEISVSLIEKLISNVDYIIIEIHSSSARQYVDFMKLSEMYQIELFSVLLRPSLDTCLERNKLRMVDDITYKINDDMVKKYYELYDVEDDLIFNNNDYTPQDVVEKILKFI